jgi:probable rRNA maturation factor
VTVEVAIANRSRWQVDADAVRGTVAGALAAEGVTAGEVGVALVEPDEMAELNGAHRGKPSPTDVLSFPIDGREPLPEGVPRQVGDLVVCPAVAAAEGTPLEVLLVHGSLHLVGYDHEIDDGRMLARQEQLLEEVAPVAAQPG